MPKRDAREQAPKGRDVSRINRVLDIRRSNAAGPIPSKSRYNRNTNRKNDQRGNWED